jgi:hypothetical protein
VIQEGAASTGIVAIIRFVMCLQPYNRYLFVFRFVPHILPLWSCKQGQQDEKSVNTCYHFRIIFDCNARQAILGFCPFLAILVCVRLAVADNL